MSHKIRVAYIDMYRKNFLSEIAADIIKANNLGLTLFGEEERKDGYAMTASDDQNGSALYWEVWGFNADWGCYLANAEHIDDPTTFGYNSLADYMNDLSTENRQLWEARNWRVTKLEVWPHSVYIEAEVQDD